MRVRRKFRLLWRSRWYRGENQLLEVREHVTCLERITMLVDVMCSDAIAIYYLPCVYNPLVATNRFRQGWGDFP